MVVPARAAEDGGPPGPSLARRMRAAAAALPIVLGVPIRTAPVPGAVVLAYHDVAAEEGDVTRWTVSAGQLGAQLRAVRASGLRLVHLHDVVDAVLSGGALDGLAAVVFDDGLVGVHRYALPVLRDLRVPATVFAVAGELGRRPSWWPGAARLMDEAELGDLVAEGVRIAAHTSTHPSLPGLDDRSLAAEIGDARRRLADLAQMPVDLFAYPFGHHDRRVRAAVAASGYRAAFTFLNGRVTTGLDRLRLPRFTMGPHQNRARLAYQLCRSPRSWPDTQVDRWPPAPSASEAV